MKAIALLAILLVAGCAGPSATVSSSSGPGEMKPTRIAFAGNDCSNIILFQLMDFANATALLPPGFHAKDPQALLSSPDTPVGPVGFPVAFGQAAAVLFMLSCATDGEGARDWRTGFAGIFVEAPAVTGAPPTANLHFYEVEHYGASLNGTLSRVGWPVHPSTIQVDTTIPTSGAINPDVTTGTLMDANGTLLQVKAPLLAPYSFASGPVRLWHDTGIGTGFFDYDAQLNPNFGPAPSCTVRAHTTISSIVGEPPALDPGPCPATPARLAAFFPLLSFTGSFNFLPGAHAQ